MKKFERTIKGFYKKEYCWDDPEISPRTFCLTDAIEPTNEDIWIADVIRKSLFVAYGFVTIATNGKQHYCVERAEGVSRSIQPKLYIVSDTSNIDIGIVEDCVKALNEHIRENYE